MPLFKKKCLFSQVSGVVLSGGQPVAGARIEHYYWWDGPEKSRRITVNTDSDGRFSADAVYDDAWMTYFLPTSPSIQQQLTIHHEDKEYEAYLVFKDNYDENGELGGKPLSLVCELGDEPSNDDGFYGICTLAE